MIVTAPCASLGQSHRCGQLNLLARGKLVAIHFEVCPQGAREEGLHFQDPCSPNAEGLHRAAGEEAEEDNIGGGDGGSRGEGKGLDPVVAALIKKLPPGGMEWTIDKRVTWLQMMEMAFRVAYQPEDVDPITIKKGSQ